MLLSPMFFVHKPTEQISIYNFWFLTTFAARSAIVWLVMVANESTGPLDISSRLVFNLLSIWYSTAHFSTHVRRSASNISNKLKRANKRQLIVKSNCNALWSFIKPFKVGLNGHMPSLVCVQTIFDITELQQQQKYNGIQLRTKRSTPTFNANNAVSVESIDDRFYQKSIIEESFQHEFYFIGARLMIIIFE